MNHYNLAPCLWCGEPLKPEQWGAHKCYKSLDRPSPQPRDFAALWEASQLASEVPFTAAQVEKAVDLVVGTVPGTKHDGEKLRWDLMHWDSLTAVVRVLMHGAKKYGSDDNWRSVPGARRRYFAAMLRHTLAWWMDEGPDEETGESHLAHAICCALFLMGGVK